MERSPKPATARRKAKIPFEVFFARKYQLPVALARFVLQWRFRYEHKSWKTTLPRYLVRYWKGRRKLIESPIIELGTENPWQYLTERQKEIANLRLQGYRNAKIAEMLKIAPSTVRTHLRAICRVVGTHQVREGLATLRLFPKPE